MVELVDLFEFVHAENAKFALVLKSSFSEKEPLFLMNIEQALAEVLFF